MQNDRSAYQRAMDLLLETTDCDVERIAADLAREVERRMHTVVVSLDKLEYFISVDGDESIQMGPGVARTFKCRKSIQVGTYETPVDKDMCFLEVNGDLKILS
jgi:hypothetical protein